jgi:hypothetical protein
MPNTISQAQMRIDRPTHKSMVCHYGIISTLYLSYLTNLKASWGTFTGRNCHHRNKIVFGLVGVPVNIPITHPNATDKATFTAGLVNTLAFYGSMTGLFLIWFIAAFAVLVLTDRYFGLVTVPVALRL